MVSLGTAKKRTVHVTEGKDTESWLMVPVIFVDDYCPMALRYCRYNNLPSDLLRYIHENFAKNVPFGELFLSALMNYDCEVFGGWDIGEYEGDFVWVGDIERKFFLTESDCFILHDKQYYDLCSWVPKPVTSDEFWLYYSSSRDFLKKNDFAAMAKSLGMIKKVEPVWKLLRRKGKEVEQCSRFDFDRMFPRHVDFLESFHQGYLASTTELSDSYADFFVRIEISVWELVNVPVCDKEETIMDYALTAIKSAVISSSKFSKAVVGEIFEYYGNRVILLPYNVNSEKRYKLRKCGIDRSRTYYAKRIEDQLVEAAIKEINELILIKVTEESESQMVMICDQEVRIKYCIPKQMILDKIINVNCGSKRRRVMRSQDVTKARVSCGPVVERLIKHFADSGYRACEIGNDELYVKGLEIEWDL